MSLEEGMFDVCFLHPAREMVDASRARELVAPLKEMKRVTRVKLSNKSYSAEAAQVVKEALLACRESITDVDVSDVIAGRPEAEALEVLGALATPFADSKLEVCDVSDNALGQKGIDALLPLFSGKTLKKLRVCNNGMSAAAAEQLSALLEKSSGGLESFHYFNNMSGDQGALSIAKIIVANCATLRDLRFSGTRAGRVGSTAVARSLFDLKHLETLDFADNTLSSDDGAGALATFIETKRPPLKRLDLRDCALGNDGFKTLADALIANKNGLLESLDFSGNDLDFESCASLPRLFLAHPRIEFFGLDDNELGTKGVLLLAKALERNKTLTSLTISSNDINSSGRAVTKLANVLKDNVVFKSLNLDGNGLTESACEQLTDILGDKLKEMDDNDVDADPDDDETDDELEDIIAAAAKIDLSPSSPRQKKEEEDS